MTFVEIFWMVRARTGICCKTRAPLLDSRASAFTRGVSLSALHSSTSTTTLTSCVICLDHFHETLDELGEAPVSPHLHTTSLPSCRPCARSPTKSITGLCSLSPKARPKAARKVMMGLTLLDHLAKSWTYDSTSRVRARVVVHSANCTDAFQH